MSSVLGCSCLHVPHPEMLSEFCPSGPWRQDSVPSLFASLLQVFLEFGKLTRDFGGRRVCHGEGSLLEHRISALSWPPTSSSELQTKSSFCLAGSVLPTSGPKDPDFYF